MVWYYLIHLLPSGESAKRNWLRLPLKYAIPSQASVIITITISVVDAVAVVAAVVAVVVVVVLVVVI